MRTAQLEYSKTADRDVYRQAMHDSHIGCKIHFHGKQTSAHISRWLCGIFSFRCIFMSPLSISNSRNQRNSVFHALLWNNRHDAVKRTKSIQKYCYDGLNTMDILAFVKSMKISWIKRLHWSQIDWSMIAKPTLPPTEQLFTFRTKRQISWQTI